MKKSDKIAVIFSVISIVGVAGYLIQNSHFFELKILRLVFVLLIAVPVGGILVTYLNLFLNAKFRISRFSKIAQRFGLKHSFVQPKFFQEYGTFNHINGLVGGHEVDIYDEVRDPNKRNELKKFATSYIASQVINVAVNKVIGGNSSVTSMNFYYNNKSTYIKIDSLDFKSNRGVFLISPYVSVRNIEIVLERLENHAYKSLSDVFSIVR